MNLQDAFYFLGIIFMSLSLVILIALAVLLFYIKKKITFIQDLVEERINDVSNFALKPVKKAVDIASSIISGKSSRKGSKS